MPVPTTQIPSFTFIESGEVIQPFTCHPSPQFRIASFSTSRVLHNSGQRFTGFSLAPSSGPNTWWLTPDRPAGCFKSKDPRLVSSNQNKEYFHTAFFIVQLHYDDKTLAWRVIDWQSVRLAFYTLLAFQRRVSSVGLCGLHKIATTQLLPPDHFICWWTEPRLCLRMPSLANFFFTPSLPHRLHSLSFTFALRCYLQLQFSPFRASFIMYFRTCWASYNSLDFSFWSLSIFPTCIHAKRQGWHKSTSLA